MKYIITIIGAVALATSGYSQSLEDLIAKLPTPSEEKLAQNAIYHEAMSNPEFYNTLRESGWTIDGTTLKEVLVIQAAFKNNDYASISDLSAAKHLNDRQYKAWVSAKVLALGETIAAYDWLQEQRLIVTQVQKPDSDKLDEFLQTIATQVLEAAKAKQ